ncbi:FAD-dependent monooxygenase [Ruminococcus sp. OA3]|uniref:NAD(P)/FAD-dependent oxidoreductase n=1 Tax=Ruminococcus sp. OA3 TaxID=2914164 RepID=UPI001F06A7E0|nr:FAD-dependent monooxygenase [Ruminococcus sp. OA3]MCH1983322.1 FAD-dependent monooxygenase [Ruminococcus sp. OA3]
MIRITQLKLPIHHTPEDIINKVAKLLKIPADRIQEYEIIRQSLDARKKPALCFVYTIDVKTDAETKVLQKVRDKNITSTKRCPYLFPHTVSPDICRPVIAGSGPAGLFCAWMLAKHGIRPIVIERGEPVEQRMKSVEHFWQTGSLNEQSNVQFGEGGAGTFSDGKLNTSVKDPKGRNHEVLKMFVEAGAPAEILYQQKPHLGTDLLVNIVKNIRVQIEHLGGEFRFETQLTDLDIRSGELHALELNHSEWIPARYLICAIGHSARDTFTMLHEKGIQMSAKSFAAGVRIEHPQEMINMTQYGQREVALLGAASYKLTHQLAGGRGIYTFCMCPGGYVVNASSEQNRLAVNGMSYHDRNSGNANSAVIVTVNPEDFQTYLSPGVPSELAGLAFQRHLEEQAYQIAGGAVPVQLFEDFESTRESRSYGEIFPKIKGRHVLSNIRAFLPGFMADALVEGIHAFGKKIPGFDRRDCLLSAVESRTSSPIRIHRDARLMSNISGIFPCGEGAGYAGGITSAAIDGLKTAEAVAAALKL